MSWSVRFKMVEDVRFCNIYWCEDLCEIERDYPNIEQDAAELSMMYPLVGIYKLRSKQSRQKDFTEGILWL